MPNFFYYDANGQKHGAFTPQQLKALATQGVINPQTPMETDAGQKGRAGQIPGLFAAPVQPAAQPAQLQSVPASVAAPVAEVAEKSRSSLLISIIGIVALLVVGGIGWMIISPGSQQAEKETFTVEERAEIEKFLAEFGTDMKSVDVEMRDEYGGTLLSAAVVAGLPAVKFLVSKGADVNAAGTGLIAGTPLYYAVATGNVEIVEFLVSNGADVNAKGGGDNAPLKVAILNEDANIGIELVKFLVSNGADVNVKDSLGLTPLHHSKNVEVVKFLVANGADVNAQAPGGITPLDFARHNNHTAIVEYLSSLPTAADQAKIREIDEFLAIPGNNVNMAIDKEDGSTFLHMASLKSGSIIVAKYLISKGANVNAKDDDGWTPLFYPATRGDVEFVKYLVSQKANVNARDNNGRTPLYLAAREGQVETVRLLVSLGADVNAKEKDDWTPLHIAAAGGELEVARTLVSLGANVNARNNNGSTPRDSARLADKTEVFRYLSNPR